MENYLAVVKVKGAKMASKASFSCEGITAAIKKMCEILQTSMEDIEDYDLMELVGAQTLRIVASRDSKAAPPWKEPEKHTYSEVEYIPYMKGVA